jgi:hypothetical protein
MSNSEEVRLDDNTLTTGYNGTLNIVGDIYQPPPSIYFGYNQEYGKIYWEDNIFKSEGNADESAKMFIDFLSKQYADYHEQIIKDKCIDLIDDILKHECEMYNHLRHRVVKVEDIIKLKEKL